VAIAVRQQVDPSYLLQRTQWAPQGWSIVRQGVIRQVPGDVAGVPLIRLQLDAYEWDDVNAFGIGNTDDALGKLRAYIQAGGSDLYAYTLFTRTAFNFLGIRVTSYRLVLLHSIVQLLEAAVVIMAIAFAAIIFIQYVTTGHSPALQDLTQAWSGVINSAGQAVGSAGGGLAQPLIWATLFAGVVAIAFAQAQKSAGVKAPIPKGPSIGATVKTKHLNVGTR
jgi:hypothetical protein